MSARSSLDGLLLGVEPDLILISALAAVLVISAVKLAATPDGVSLPLTNSVRAQLAGLLAATGASQRLPNLINRSYAENTPTPSRTRHLLTAILFPTASQPHDSNNADPL